MRLLLSSEAGLEKTKAPLVFPIFGRGRVLGGLEVKAKEIEEAARFLCGACSCQVKELNPGVDLPGDGNETGRTAGTADAEEVPAVAATRAPKIPPGLPSTSIESPARKEEAAPCTRCRLWLWGEATAGAVALLFGAWAAAGTGSATRPG